MHGVQILGQDLLANLQQLWDLWVLAVLDGLVILRILDVRFDDALEIAQVPVELKGFELTKVRHAIEMALILSLQVDFEVLAELLVVSFLLHGLWLFLEVDGAVVSVQLLFHLFADASERNILEIYLFAAVGSYGSGLLFVWVFGFKRIFRIRVEHPCRDHRRQF